jgi:hypothetical protein
MHAVYAILAGRHERRLADVHDIRSELQQRALALNRFAIGALVAGVALSRVRTAMQKWATEVARLSQVVDPYFANGDFCA